MREISKNQKSKERRKKMIKIKELNIEKENFFRFLELKNQERISKKEFNKLYDILKLREFYKDYDIYDLSYDRIIYFDMNSENYLFENDYEELYIFFKIYIKF